RLGHTWRLERKSIPRGVDRDLTHQGRTRLLCEGQDLVLITCPPLNRLALAALGHGPGERAIRVEGQRDGRLLVWFGRPLALQVLWRGRRRGHVLRCTRLALRPGSGVVADSGLGEIHRLCRAGVASLCELRGELRWLGGRGTEGRREPCG